MTRNLVVEDQAEENRARPGALTFNAYPPDDYAGVVIVVACVRIGDHAHVHVDSGRQRPAPDGSRPTLNRGFAGKLTLRWHEWLVLREILDADLRVRIAEVENPTPGMAWRYGGARP